MSGRRLPYYLAGLAAVLTIVLYLPALGNDFVGWDEDDYIYENQAIRSLDGAFIRWAFTTFHAGNWHPLTWVSHALDYSIWGLEPFGHHLSSILLHGINTFLVVLLCIRLMEAANTSSWLPSGGTGSTSLIAGGVAGLLFGIHPLHVESVAWVAERKDLLCAVFYLLSVLSYLKYRSNKSYRTYFLSLAFFILALMSKPMAVSLPLVLLILDWYPFERLGSPGAFRAAVIEKVPFFTLGLVSSVLTMMAQAPAIKLMDAVPFWARLLVGIKALLMYLLKMAVPVGLNPFYPYPRPQEVLLSDPYYAFSLLFAVTVTAVLVVKAKRWRFSLAVWGYYVVTLIPVIGIIQVGSQAMADRYTYLPGLGPFFFAGVVAAKGWTGALTGAGALKGARRKATQVAAGVVTVSLLACFSYLSNRQMGIWKNGIVFWSYVIEKNRERVPFAYNNRGMAFRDAGDLERAIEDFNKAISLGGSRIDYTLAYGNLKFALEEKEYLDEVMKNFDRALALNPSDPRAYYDRGVVFGETGRYRLALADFDKAIELGPNYADAYTGRGFVLEKMGLLRRALEDLDRAIALRPSGVDAYINRGVVFEGMHRLDRAIEDYDRAIRLDPSDYLVYSNRAAAFSRKGLDDRAIDDYSIAISLNPGLLKAYLERGRLYLKTGDRRRAEADFQKARSLEDRPGA